MQGGGSNVAIAGFLSDQATIRRGDAQMKGHLVSGHVPLLASSRQLTQSERAAFRSRYGYDPIELPIALDAVGIYVNGGNPIQGLTMQQVDAIFSKDRKRGFSQALTKWGDLGLDQGWGLQDIRLHGREKGSGTRTFFIDEALLGGAMDPLSRKPADPPLRFLISAVIDLESDMLELDFRPPPCVVRSLRTQDSRM